MAWRRLFVRAGSPQDLPAGEDARAPDARERELADFTMGWEVFRLIPLAFLIGVLATVVALVLVDFIGLLLNLMYAQRVSVVLHSPTRLPLGAWSIPIPIAGGLIVGLMARYGSERIRGHGIPEAIESILTKGSEVKPRLVVLKPVSSAIAIGTGGPFGAEGPIIMTGGALGSVVAQLFRLSALERRALLVAGAAAGMTAIFGTPVAAVLLAIELMLFELKPRSIVPVGVACVVADIMRSYFGRLGLILAAPLFPVHGVAMTGWLDVSEAAFIGVAGAALGWVLTKSVYAAEDAFRRLPIHWMWWPAIGGLAIGVGGYFAPRALGVGYDTISAELAGRLAIATLLITLAVKLGIWAIALGSGTSGGVLAPLLLMGAAMGGAMSPMLSGANSGTWALIGMAATIAGVMRTPLTAVLFAFELTRSVGTLLPILAASVVAYLLSVLVLKRSILTEKIARRGFHLLREYTVDPLETIFVRESMLADVLTLRPDSELSELFDAIREHPEYHRQRLYPVVDDERVLLGAVAESHLYTARWQTRGCRAEEVMRADLTTCYPDMTLRQAADRMAIREVGVLPVVEPDTGRLRGILTQFHLLLGRERHLDEERQREQPLALWRVRRRPGRAGPDLGEGTELLAVEQPGDGESPAHRG